MFGHVRVQAHVFVLWLCVLAEEIIQLGLKVVCSVDGKQSDSFSRGSGNKIKSKLKEELSACQFGIQVRGSFRAHQKQDYE